MSSKSTNEKMGDRLYDKIEPIAYFIKIILQMLIGLAAASLICGMVGRELWVAHDFPSELEVITLIAAALGSAAAIELAYNLFTRGPDEAVEPVILGISAIILLKLGSGNSTNWSDGLFILFCVIALAILFAVRHVFIGPHKPQSGSVKAFIERLVARLRG